MSSLLTQISQVDSSTKYVLALKITTVYIPNANASITALMPSTDFSSSTTTSTYPIGTLFRDMGKRVSTYTTRNQEIAKYISVQPQLGALTEGVPANYAIPMYVQVWASASSPIAVTVGRTG